MTDELAGVKVDMSETAKANDEAKAPETTEAPETTGTAAPEEGSALATESETGQTEKPEGDDSKPITENAQKAINKQYRLRKEAEEREEAARQELERAQAELQKARGTDQEPVIPAAPDPYDEDYAEKMATREKAIEARAAWQAQQSLLKEQQAEAQRQAQFAEQQRLAEMADSYASRAQALGVNGESLQKASEVVTGYGVPDDLVKVLLQDEDGPLITQYLATDIPTLDQLARMSPLEQGQFLEREVRAKAQALKPQPSSAPPPPDTLTGAGPGEDILGPHKGVVIK